MSPLAETSITLLSGQSKGEKKHDMGHLDAQDAANKAAVLLVSAKAPDVCAQVSQARDRFCILSIIAHYGRNTLLGRPSLEEARHHTTEI